MKFFTPLLLATYVAAHGYVYQVIIDGQTYVGNPPNADPNPSITRQISQVDPVKGADNPNVNCGQDAQPAALTANAIPGSSISFDWRGGDLSKWPHDIGPMMTYMASCGSATCDKFNSTQAKWFLIDRAGQFPNGTWAQQALMNGDMATVQIPSNLASGNYIVRHEIIALHLANTIGGAEFYPSCTQLSVGGSQTGSPQSSDLVSLPGAYKDTDPGIFDPNVFNSGASYTFPGPSIASFITGSDSSGQPSSTSSTQPPSSTGSSSSSGSSKKCKLRRVGNSNSTSSYRRRALQYHHHHRPRSISRIMRNVIFGESQIF